MSFLNSMICLKNMFNVEVEEVTLILKSHNSQLHTKIVQCNIWGLSESMLNIAAGTSCTIILKAIVICKSVKLKEVGLLSINKIVSWATFQVIRTSSCLERFSSPPPSSNSSKTSENTFRSLCSRQKKLRKKSLCSISCLLCLLKLCI
jgi:hypothetical protein